MSPFGGKQTRPHEAGPGPHSQSCPVERGAWNSKRESALMCIAGAAPIPIQGVTDVAPFLCCLVSIAEGSISPL